MSSADEEGPQGRVPTPFERSMTLEAVGGGRYSGDVGAGLSFNGQIHGGVGLALALRAAGQDLDAPELSFRSGTAVFVSPLPAGPVRADVRVLRRGGSMAQCAVDLGAGEDVGPSLSVVAAFGRARSGRRLRGRTAPFVPAPDHAPDFQDAPSGVGAPPAWVFQPMWETTERRIAVGHGWWDTDRPPGCSEGALWLRYRSVPRLESGQVDPSAHVALSDVLVQAVSEGLGAEDFGFLSIDHTVHLLGHTADEWCLVTHRCEHLDDGYASLRGEVWDEHGSLLATSTQLGLVIDA